MNSPSSPEVSSEVALAKMNAVVYSIFCAGTGGYEDLFPETPHAAGIQPDVPYARRAGVAYDEENILKTGKKAVDFFTAAFYGPEPQDTTGTVLLRQITEEFAGTAGKAVTSDLSADRREVPGKIEGEPIYCISEPPPEIIRERNLILYQYTGKVVIRARYGAGDCEETVNHSLLTLSRNAYMPAGGLPVVRVGVPARTFRWAEA